MSISIVICTWNRASLLQQTLNRLVSVKKPEDVKWEVLVVNNNCTDHTAAIVEEFAERLPIRMAIEPEQGLSAARNRGIQEAQSDLIIWTDDDVLVGDSWLIEYARALKAHPSVALFGGPIEPWFDGNPPAWLVKSWRVVESAYAVRDLGEHEAPLTEKRLPFGANFAIRRDIQSQFPFDTRLGRRGANLLSGEETKVMTGILNAGYPSLWLPKASVRHFVGADRQNLGYLRRYYRAIGATRIRLMHESPHMPKQFVEAKSLFGMPLWLLRSAAINELQYLALRPFGDPDQWLPKLQEASTQLGMAIEQRRLKASRS